MAGIPILKGFRSRAVSERRTESSPDQQSMDKKIPGAVDIADLSQPLPGEARRLEILRETDVFSSDNHTAYDHIMSLTCRALKVNSSPLQATTSEPNFHYCTIVVHIPCHFHG